MVLAALAFNHNLARSETPPEEQVQLQLEINLNGYPLNLIGAFIQLPDGRIGSLRSELMELGIAVDPNGPPDEIIKLDDVPGLSYVYDDENQVIEIEAGNGARVAKAINAKGDREVPKAEVGTGLVLNYTAYSAASYNVDNDLLDLNGGSLSLDARAYSRFGTLRQTGVVGTTTYADMTLLRLDTVWSYSDENRALTYQLGDIISGGLSWTRPIRLGGGQAQRNFDLRPDLITKPLPLVEGSAGVPSTLDVYINGTKTYSGQVAEGPFRIDNIPVYTNSGKVRVVLTDATGREVETEQDFITSPDLLKRDLYDFSLDAGFVRRDYGSDSFGYNGDLAAVGTLRYGLTDIITGEAHIEAGMGLYEGGVGLLFNGGDFGLFSGAIAASTYDGMSGFYVQGGWEATFGDLKIQLQSSRTFGDFADLAAVSALGTATLGDVSVPRALDQATISYALRDYDAGVGLSLVHRELNSGKRDFIVSGSYSQTVWDNVTVFANAYADFGDDQSYGAFVGMSFPLWSSVSATTGANLTEDYFDASAEVSKPFDQGDLPVSWRVSHSEGQNRYTSASGAVKTRVGTLDGRISKSGDAMRANATMDGAVVVAGGTVMAGRRIHDAFAIVDAGAEGVSVEYENRYAGKTGANGKLLLTHLNAFQRNKIAIDPEGLPLTAGIDETERIVVPREMSGVVVDLAVRADEVAALVVLKDASGALIPESSEVFLDGVAEPFVSGYDGQVYLTGIGARNRITVKYRGNECHATFDHDTGDDSQATIGPLTCT